MEETSALDPSALERLRQLGGDKFARDMIALFLSYGGQKVAEAVAARQGGNLAGVASAAHALKSSAGNVGAVQVQQSRSKPNKRPKAGNRRWSRPASPPSNVPLQSSVRGSRRSRSGRKPRLYRILPAA